MHVTWSLASPTTLGKRPLTICMIPTTRDKLIPELNDGLGDIAAGNLTVTAARLTQVDFPAPTDHQAGAGVYRHRANLARGEDA